MVSNVALSCGLGSFQTSCTQQAKIRIISEPAFFFLYFANRCWSPAAGDYRNCVGHHIMLVEQEQGGGKRRNYYAATSTREEGGIID